MGLISAVITSIAIIAGLIRGKSKIIIGILLLLLYIMFTFEYSTEGDYYTYVLMYNQIGSDFGRAITYEPLYVLVSQWGNSLNLSFDESRSIIAIIEVLLLWAMAKHYTKNIGMVLAAFMIYPALNSAELFRWLAAMILVIYGFRFIIEDNSIKNAIMYGVFVIGASLFHTSCWFFLLFYLLLIKKKKLIIMIVPGIIIVFYFLIGTGDIFNILALLPIREFVIQKYETGYYSNVYGVIYDIMKLLFIMSMSLVAGGLIKFENYKIIFTNKISDLANRVYFSKIIYINIIFMVLIIPMYYSSLVYRLTQVAIVLNYIALAKRYEIEESKFVLVYILFSSIVLLLAILLYDGNQALIPFESHFTEGYMINLYNTIKMTF